MARWWVTAFLASGVDHAFLSSGGTMTDLGVLGGYWNSYASDINASRQVVGYCFNTSPYYETCPFLYSDGTMIDPNSLIDQTSGWTITKVDAINDLGQIVGEGIYNGTSADFILTPTPEPSTLHAGRGGYRFDGLRMAKGGSPVTDTDTFSRRSTAWEQPITDAGQAGRLAGWHQQDHGQANLGSSTRIHLSGFLRVPCRRPGLWRQCRVMWFAPPSYGGDHFTYRLDFSTTLGQNHAR